MFRFIPSDAGILKRYKEAATFFTGINDKIKDKDFEITSPFTILDSGEMFAEQIITVIGGIIEKELDAREKAQQKRIKKYTDKYAKKEVAEA